MRRVLGALFAGLVACGPPDFVDDVAKIDGYLSGGKFDHACVGLKMRDPVVRLGTAERLVKYPAEPVARDCLCAALVDGEKGAWDADVAAKLVGTRHAHAAACLLGALEDARVGNRADLVGAVVQIGAPESADALQKLVRHDANAAVRARALEGLQGAPDALDLARDVLASDPDAGMRRAAVAALVGRPGPEPRKALVTAAQTDADPGVRAAAFGALGKATDVAVIDAACKALSGDADASVRVAAAGSLAGTTVARAATCLAKRLAEGDEDGAAREALLAAARSSPHATVTKALCDQIVPWLRRYVVSDIASRTPGFDIVEAQNNADWKQSYACVERALSQGGLSCYARNYLAHWFTELGGKAKAPWCPGMMRGTE